MEFSTKVVEKMAAMMAEELGNHLPAPKDIREVERGMRELLRQVGAEGLSRYLEGTDEAELREKEKKCECQGKQQYMFRREAVILSVFGRVSYKRRYYVCQDCGKGQSPLDKRLHLAAGEVTAGLAELLALAGVETAFAESSRLIERFLLIRISDNTVRKETERFGQLQQTREEEWKVQSQNESWLQERGSLVRVNRWCHGSMQRRVARNEKHCLVSGGTGALLQATSPSCQCGRRTEQSASTRDHLSLRYTIARPIWGLVLGNSLPAPSRFT
jgi:hypothetical protein